MGKCYGAGSDTARLNSEHAPEESERIGTVEHCSIVVLVARDLSRPDRSELTRSCSIA